VARCLLAVLAGLALVVTAACGGATDDGQAAPGFDDGDEGGDDGDPGDDGIGIPPPSGASCSPDPGCEAAASTCCACPTFAVPAGAGWNDACEDVPCPAPASCPDVLAVCADGGCALVCAEVTCGLTCETGFAVDAAGCLTCACAPRAPPACTTASDCVQVAADCCGCSRGGADTAVLVGAAAEHVRGLGCTGGEVCPDIDVCHPAAAPACRNGACVLVTSEDGPPGALPDGACGRADLAACPAGERCVLNRSPAADAAGVGMCAAP
jgi:hypothetical protein